MKIITVSGEVWVWVHQKYGIIQTILHFYSLETNNFYYLNVPDDDQLNRQNNET